MFSNTSKNGFHITFANGYTVSVQWNAMNYCDNRSYARYEPDPDYKPCANAEVACWGSDGVWLRLGEDDDVIGFQTPEQVTAILDRISKLAPRPRRDRDESIRLRINVKCHVN